MKIYLASGYGTMNVKGREAALAGKFKIYRRLVSFYDLERGNHIERVIKVNYEDIPCRKHPRSGTRRKEV